ncbi:hypothetical protein B4W75_10475 [Staphylococcus intermedius]|nr:hypothetical protein B5C04_00495 [Staphylococcus intermedius]PCF79256.1 hypothetical protein B4W69_13425 [Staphylococcus delphini]PCF82670.1 hypothetical protein B4W70_00495 [Staphylococcus intermedius]PCF86473.1 hypothetical protein B4W75_10475 [Staphylococcus intermedius]
MNDIEWKDIDFIGLTRSQKAKMIHKDITPSIALSRYKNYWSIEEIVNTKPYTKRRKRHGN